MWTKFMYDWSKTFLLKLARHFRSNMDKMVQQMLSFADFSAGSLYIKS